MNRQYVYLKNFNLCDYIIASLRYNKIKKHIPSSVIMLDLGCAYNAPFLYSVSAKLKRGFGIDIDINKEKSNEHITLIQWDLNQGTLPDTPPLDVITSLALLEHLENPQKLLRTAYNRLKPNGRLILTVPSSRAKPILEFLAFKLKLIEAGSIKQHKRYFNKQEIVALCKNAGFTTIAHSYFQLGLNNFVLAQK